MFRKRKETENDKTKKEEFQETQIHKGDFIFLISDSGRDTKTNHSRLLWLKKHLVN